MPADQTHLTDRGRRATWLLLVHWAAACLLVLAILCHAQTAYDPGDMLPLLSWLLVVLTVWSLASWTLATGSLFDPYAIFLVMVVVFNGGHAFLAVAGLIEGGILGGVFSAETTLHALLLVVLGLTGLHFGALAAAAWEGPAPVCQPVEAGEREANRAVGWLLLLISAIPHALLMKDAIAKVNEGGYFALYGGAEPIGLDAGPNVLATLLVPGVLFLLVGAASRGERLLSGVVVVVSSLTYFFLGYRAYAAMPLLAYAWAVDRSVWRIPRPLLAIAGAGLLLVVFPLVRQVRDASGEEREAASAASKVVGSLGDSGVATITEMGASLNTVAYTVELVPENRPYDRGLSYLYAVSTVMPNLFWDIHPAVARRTPGDWLIWTVDPGTAERGGSLGYSCIAEAYLNFGTAGTPLYMAAFGLFLALAVRWASRDPRPQRIVAVACLLNFLSHYPRGEFQTVSRSLIWFTLLPYLLVVLQLRLRRHLW